MDEIGKNVPLDVRHEVISEKEEDLQQATSFLHDRQSVYQGSERLELNLA